MKKFLILAALLPTQVNAVNEAGDERVIEEGHAYEATRVLVGDCLFADKEIQSKGLVAGLSALAIEAGINLVSSALKSAGEGGVKSFTGTGNFRLNVDEMDNSCIQVVRGSFWSDSSRSNRKPHPSWASSMGLESSHLRTLESQHFLYLARAPDFMFEGRLRRASEDNRVFTIRPLYTALNKPFERPMIDHRGGSRHIALLFSFVSPDSALDAADNPGTEVVIGELKRKKHIRFDFDNDQSGSVAAFNQNVDDKSVEIFDAEGTYVPWPQESRWFNLGDNYVGGPMTARVVVTETRSESTTFKFLSGAFEASKEELTTSLEKLLIPSKKKEAQLAELKAQALLDGAADTDFISAIEKLNICAIAASGDGFEQKKARYQASQIASSEQAKSNRSALAASRQPSFGTLVTPSSSEGVKKKCEDAIKF